MKSNYCVFDLECTCEESNSKRFFKETIEIGAVKFDKDMKIIDELTIFIKPVINKTLTNFCKQLTTITQDMVDEGIPFDTGFKTFINFIEDCEKVFSWGYFDMKQLKKEYNISTLRYNSNINWIDKLAIKHINVKVKIAEIRNQKPCGVKKIMNQLHIPLVGTLHRGIDDAKNMMTIIERYKDKLL